MSRTNEDNVGWDSSKQRVQDTVDYCLFSIDSNKLSLEEHEEVITKLGEDLVSRISEHPEPEESKFKMRGDRIDATMILLLMIRAVCLAAVVSWLFLMYCK